MRYVLVLCGLGLVGIVVACLFIAQHLPHEVEPMEQILALSPNVQTIQQKIAANPKASRSEREQIFAEMFTQRFRIHDLKMAVRLRFIERTPSRSSVANIRLMCPARTEPWNVDRLALAAWREVRICLQEDCDIDIYETYIGALPRKIGVLRTTAGLHPNAHIEVVPDLRKHNDHDR